MSFHQQSIELKSKLEQQCMTSLIDDLVLSFNRVKSLMFSILFTWGDHFSVIVLRFKSSYAPCILYGRVLPRCTQIHKHNSTHRDEHTRYSRQTGKMMSQPPRVMKNNLCLFKALLGPCLWRWWHWTVSTLLATAAAAAPLKEVNLGGTLKQLCTWCCSVAQWHGPTWVLADETPNWFLVRAWFESTNHKPLGLCAHRDVAYLKRLLLLPCFFYQKVVKMLSAVGQAIFSCCPHTEAMTQPWIRLLVACLLCPHYLSLFRCVVI